MRHVDAESRRTKDFLRRERRTKTMDIHEVSALFHQLEDNRHCPKRCGNARPPGGGREAHDHLPWRPLFSLTFINPLL